MKNRAIVAVICGLMLLSLSLFGCTPETEVPVGPAASFPEKPVTIVNYVAAGGGMDVTTRKFAQIAAKYTDATFVVENRTGAGGIIGMDYVLSQPADGYNIFAATTSNISTIVSGQHDVDKYVGGFDWIAMIMEDPESIIVNSKHEIDTMEEVIADALTKEGSQIWVGPSTGGNDHVVAMKVWDALGIEAVWVPFESGPMAMNALLGGQGVAYVGNPADTSGRPDLKNAVVSSAERLPAYPDVPTFGELGYPELDGMVMWRGFAVRSGTPIEAIEWFQDICEKVTNDQEWIEYHEEVGIKVVNHGTEQYEQRIQQDIDDHVRYLRKFGLID